MSKPSSFIDWIVFIVKVLIAILPHAKDLFEVIGNAIDDYNSLSSDKQAKVKAIADA